LYLVGFGCLVTYVCHRVARWYTNSHTKNPNLGIFWRALEWKLLVFFMAIWFILQPFGIFCSFLVCFEVIWYIFPILDVLPRKIWQPWYVIEIGAWSG
jgi:hypothetical protein